MVWGITFGRGVGVVGWVDGEEFDNDIGPPWETCPDVCEGAAAVYTFLAVSWDIWAENGLPMAIRTPDVDVVTVILREKVEDGLALHVYLLGYVGFIVYIASPTSTAGRSIRSQMQIAWTIVYSTHAGKEEGRYGLQGISTNNKY